MRTWRPHPMTVLEVGLGLAAFAAVRRRAGDPERGLSREEIIAARSRASLADFMQHGPRLWADRQCYVLARSSDGQRALLGGVGSMGIGRMWTSASSHEGDPTFRDAPVDDEAQDDFGQNGRGEVALTPRLAIVLRTDPE